MRSQLVIPGLLTLLLVASANSRCTFVILVQSRVDSASNSESQGSRAFDQVFSADTEKSEVEFSPPENLAVDSPTHTDKLKSLLDNIDVNEHIRVRFRADWDRIDLPRRKRGQLPGNGAVDHLTHVFFAIAQEKEASQNRRRFSRFLNC